MPKRLTDTEKWKKPFIKSLSVEYKLFFLYILDDCDHSGIWQVDIEVAEIRLGVKLSLQKARGFYAEKIVELDGGTKWFIPDFIQFQYGQLDEKNKMYKTVFYSLSKYNLMGHLSPINGGKVQVKEKDKEQVMVWEGEKQKFLADEKWAYQFVTSKGLTKALFDQLLSEFLNDLELKEQYKTVPELRDHFTNWFNKYKNGTHRNIPPKTGKSAGANAAVEKLAARLNSRGEPGPFG
jgi:hypothetical protein